MCPLSPGEWVEDVLTNARILISTCDRASKRTPIVDFCCCCDLVKEGSNAFAPISRTDCSLRNAVVAWSLYLKQIL